MTALATQLEALPELDADALRFGGRYRLDEWPARLQGMAPSSPGQPLIVAPRDATGVAAIVRWASATGRRVQALGLGSNVTGAVDDTVDVLISAERLADIEIGYADGTVRVGAGCDGRSVEAALQAARLTLGHYPQSLHVSTVGGWIATRATGTYSAAYGGIEQLLVGAEYVDPSGEIVTIPVRPRPSGGLDLLRLLCGAEGTLGIVTSATLAVAAVPFERRVCAAVPSLTLGLDVQREIVQAGLPLGLVRLYNPAESRHVARPGSVSDGECLLVVTTVGPEPVADVARRCVESAITAHGGRVVGGDAADPWFANRYADFGFMSDRNQDPRKIFDTIEVALPWSSAAACAELLETRLSELSRPLYLHFSHVYRTGVCLYAILFLTGADAAQAHARWREAWSVALDTAHAHGGTLAHHHGVGALRAARYRRTPEGRLHRRIVEACDPHRVLAAPLLDASHDVLADRAPIGAERA
jgi:alkyldihydroxyacetonephosphate synthase